MNHARNARAPARNARNARARAPYPNLARNSPRSVFNTAHKRCNSNDHILKFERFTWKLRATLLGNHARNAHNTRNARNARTRARARARARRIHIRTSTGRPPHTTRPTHTARAHRKSPGLVPRGYGTRPGPGQRLSAGALTP